MKRHNINILWEAFKSFYYFSPSRQNLVLLLMMAQGISAGIGLLFIIPLLHLVGFDFGHEVNSGMADSVHRIFNSLGVKIQLEHILLAYIVIVSIIASLRYLLTVNTSKMQQSYIRFLRHRLYRQLLHSNWQFIVNNKMSDFIHSLTGQVQAIGQASQLMLNFLSQLILSVIMVSLAFLLSWQMSLLAIAFSCLLLILLLPLNRVIFGSGHRELMSFKAIFQMLSEQLGSLKMIKSYASETYHADKLEEVSEVLEAQHVHLSKMNALTQWIYLVCAVIFFSIFFYISQTILAVPLPTIFLLLVICSRLLPQLTGLQKIYQQLVHKVPAIDDVQKMMKKCTAAQEVGSLEWNTLETDIREVSNIKQASPQLNYQLRGLNVNFTYAGKNHSVFRNLSFEIKKNQTVALVGPSGAGKSTLADLLAGLLEADSGGIYCDDILIDRTCRLGWRQTVAYVTQEVFLFHNTVKANLSWVCPHASDDELWRVLTMAAADEFVARLPQGMDTLIGDRGIQLSGGERQRLALARALLTQPQLLILDEATSALDDENEQKIQAALKKLHGKLTIVIIAHRETTIAHADHRIELEA